MQPVAQSLVFDHPAFDDHEQVVFCHDRATGLQAIVAIHNTNLGPALGGTRMWAYRNALAAQNDVLRLSRAMTYKNALIGNGFGGGKAVIIGDPRRDKTDAMLRAFARHVERLGGQFITGEDVGIKIRDVDVMAEHCQYMRGTSRSRVGDPSAFTALGVFKGIEAAVKHRLGRVEFDGMRICVQGLGNVGMRLCRMLHRAGARLVVSDIQVGLVRQAESEFEAETICPEQAHAADVDIFAPCALGAVLNRRTVPELRAQIVAGSANNQLETNTDGDRLRKREILYAPDYVINAGGVLSIAQDTPEFSPARLRRDVIAIADVLARIYKRAQDEDQATSFIADRMAEERINAHGQAVAA